MPNSSEESTRGKFFVPRASWSTVIYIFILAIIIIAIAISMTDVNHKFLSILTMAGVVSLPAIGGAIFGNKKDRGN